MFPEGNKPLPAVTDPPVDALIDNGAVDDRVLLLVLVYPNAPKLGSTPVLALRQEC